ncbi:MAG: hypothetical protein QG635_1634 [Bacteroidota bacterium]|nr:hypothetical protein [Bacteroidota bacterium]
MKNSNYLIKLFFLLSLIIVLAGCSHKINKNYYVKTVTPASDCSPIVIKGGSDLIQKEKILGKINLGDTGFSVNCSKKKAFLILKEEACKLGANLINIIKESRPNFWSSCFRCQAEFYYVPADVFEKLKEKTYYPYD